MANVASRIRRIRMQMEREMQIALQRTAVVAEGIAKEQSGEFWANDSGSAAESITGFNPEIESPDRNFPNWAYAWNNPNYISPKNHNPYTNFIPVVEQVKRDENYEAYLSMFVEYADKIGGDELLSEVIDDVGGTLANQVAAAFKRALA